MYVVLLDDVTPLIEAPVLRYSFVKSQFIGEQSRLDELTTPKPVLLKSSVSIELE
jgi:hypothetical protein